MPLLRFSKRDGADRRRHRRESIQTERRRTRFIQKRLVMPLGRRGADKSAPAYHIAMAYNPIKAIWLNSDAALIL